MLSDLDQRQAGNNDNASASTGSGSTENDAPQIAAVFPLNNNRSRRPYIKYTFYFVVVALLSAITWFSYSIYSQTTNKVAVNTAAQVKTQVVKPVVKTKQTRQNLVQPEQTPVQKEIPIKKPVVAVPQIPVQQVTSAEMPGHRFIDDEQQAEPVNEEELNRDIRAVHKQNHQLSPRQLAEVTYQKGYQLLNQNKVYSAEAKLQLVLEHDPKHIKAREMLTALYLKMGRKVEAEEVLSKGLLYVPGYSNFAKLQARLFIDNNKVERAVRILQQHKPAISEDPDYYALLAASYQRQKQHAAAANIYVKLLKLKPREGIWWVGMAISLEALGKTKQAREAYEKAAQTGTLNSRVSNYSSQRLKLLQPVADSE